MNSVKVTVVMPVNNGAMYLNEAIESILQQTYENWEMLIINERNSEDGSAGIVKSYEKKDSRICLIQNEQKLGLAESLNVGLRKAKGEYIARLDADDVAINTRFEKQVKLLDNSPEIDICGSWQRHFGTENWIHKPPSDPELCKAYLLFFCHLCHSTLMLRRSVFEENNLFYDGRYVIEDFELWSRAVGTVKFTNIQEVLGEYRHGDQNRYNSKAGVLREEHGMIVAKTLKNFLNIEVSEESYFLLSAYANIYSSKRFFMNRKAFLIQLENILREIWKANQEHRFYEDNALLSAMLAKWRWSKYGVDWKIVEQVGSLDEIFRKRYERAWIKRLSHSLGNNSPSGCIKKIFRLIQH